MTDCRRTPRRRLPTHHRWRPPLNTSRPTTRLCVLTASLLAAGLLTACGGGDANDAATAQPQATAAGGHATIQATTNATAAGTTVAPYFATWAFNDHSY